MALKQKRVAFVHLLLADGRQADLPLLLDTSRHSRGLLSEEPHTRTANPATRNCRLQLVFGLRSLLCRVLSGGIDCAHECAVGQQPIGVRRGGLLEPAVAIFSDQVSKVQDVTSGAMLGKQESLEPAEVREA